MILQFICRVLIAFMCFSSVCFGTPYVINLAETLAQSYEKEDIKAFFTLAYEETGIRPEFVYYPSQRGLNLVNQGKLDADAARFREVGEQFDNLVRIEEPLGSIEFLLVCLRNTECHTENRKVGMITGFFVGEAICEALYLDCHIAKDFSTLGKLLESARIDSILIIAVSTPSVLCDLQAKQIYYKSLDQFSQPVFHFVHKSHIDLVVPLERQIRKTRTSEIGKKITDTWKLRIESCGKTLQKI